MITFSADGKSAKTQQGVPVRITGDNMCPLCEEETRPDTCGGSLSWTTEWVFTRAPLWRGLCIWHATLAMPAGAVRGEIAQAIDSLRRRGVKPQAEAAARIIEWARRLRR